MSDPVPEPQAPEPQKEAPEPVVETPEEVEPEEGSNWPLYVGLGVGNILIVVLAFVAYRVIMGGSKDESLEDLEAALETDAAEPETLKPIEKEEPASDEPQMDASAGIEPEDVSIDLSSDDLDDASIPDLNSEAELTAEADELLAGLQDPDAPEEPELMPEADLDVMDEASDDSPGFSLDDFSPDSLDDLISDGDDKKE